MAYYKGLQLKSLAQVQTGRFKIRILTSAFVHEFSVYLYNPTPLNAADD